VRYNTVGLRNLNSATGCYTRWEARGEKNPDKNPAGKWKSRKRVRVEKTKRNGEEVLHVTHLGEKVHKKRYERKKLMGRQSSAPKLVSKCCQAIEEERIFIELLQACPISGSESMSAGEREGRGAWGLRRNIGHRHVPELAGPIVSGQRNGRMERGNRKKKKGKGGKRGLVKEIFRRSSGDQRKAK